MQVCHKGLKSLPARVAWIEIELLAGITDEIESLPARVAWIEILDFTAIATELE